MSLETTTAPIRPSQAQAHRALIALCISVTTAYGVLYYAFTVLAPAIATQTGWSAPAVTAAFSAGNLIGALAGVAVGRIIQARGPRIVMSAASLLGSGAIALVAIAPNLPVFMLGWLLAGTATAGTFYPPAFAALTGWFGTRRVWAVTTLSLAAGFASTIFAPLTAFLAEHLSWRGAYLALAAILLLVTTPAHLFALHIPWQPAIRSTRPRPDRVVVTSSPFLLVTASGTLAALAMYTSIVHLVALLSDQGVTLQLAAWILGISGAGQVAGRLFYPWLDRRFAPRIRAAVIIGVLGLTLIALALAPPVSGLIIAVAALSGAARGLFTLINATVIGDYWGTERFAALNGIYNAPIGIATALAPAFGAAIAAWTGSYRILFMILGVIALLAALLAFRADDHPDALLPTTTPVPG